MWEFSDSEEKTIDFSQNKKKQKNLMQIISFGYFLNMA